MPNCPRCGKKFLSDTQVTRHISQPASHCAKLTDDLFEHIQLPHHALEPFVDDLPDFGFDDPVDDLVPDFFTTTTFREDFPGASKTYGSGSTFMSQFDLDEHSDKRRDNLYYPFASRADWQLASFLLSSEMSMKRIDKFLSLDLVCIIFLPVAWCCTH